MTATVEDMLQRTPAIEAKMQLCAKRLLALCLFLGVVAPSVEGSAAGQVCTASLSANNLRLRGGISEDHISSLPGMHDAMNKTMDMMKQFSKKFEEIKDSHIMTDILSSPSLKSLYEDMLSGKPINLIKYFTDPELIKIFQKLSSMLGFPDDIGAAGEKLAAMTKAAGLTDVAANIEKAAGFADMASKMAKNFFGKS